MIRIKLKSLDTLKEFIEKAKPDKKLEITIDEVLSAEDLQKYVYSVAPTLPGYEFKIFYVRSGVSTSITAEYEKIDFKTLFKHAIEKFEMKHRELPSSTRHALMFYSSDITVKREKLWYILPRPDKVIAKAGLYPQFDYDINRWSKQFFLYVDRQEFETIAPRLEPITAYLEKFGVTSQFIQT